MLKISAIAVSMLASALMAFQPAPAHADANIEFYFGIDPYQNRNYYDDRVTCRQARRILRHHYGYHNITTIDCLGDSYKFFAWRHGSRYKIRLNAWTGRITRARRR
jgi:hypothetical protein